MAPAPKLCNLQRRDHEGMDIPCGTELTPHESGAYCKMRADHIRPFVTGFCNSGFHEGQKARTYSGAPAMTCRFWLVCPCQCHATLSQMFKMTGEQRITIYNPEYQHPKITGMLTWDERAQIHADAKERDRLERAAKMADEPDGGTEIYSPSGRTRKGLLDEWVEFQCKMWSLAPELQGDCTPAMIAERIALMQDIPEPSHGAVDAVLRRWVAVGYARMESKPTRFVGFTEEGERLGLQVLKEKHRLQKTGYQQVGSRRHG